MEKINTQTEKEITKIAEYLKIIMKNKGITANQIIVKNNLHNSKVYSVLRMGKFKKNYTINTLLEVCNAVGVDFIAFFNK